MTVPYQIRACTLEDIEVLVETIRTSFQDVAARFCLNEENAPRHPSNCTGEWIQKDMERGVIYYVVEMQHLVVGCVAYERANVEMCYLQRLAVIPAERRRGFGKALVVHVLANAKRLGVHHVNIGIIAEQAELKRWYRGIGFVEGESKTFAHLPFRVTFLSYTIP